MKKLVILIGLVFATSTFANENCYDRAVGAVQSAKEAIASCGTNIDTSAFDTLADRLDHWTTVGILTGVYQKKIISSMGKIYELYNTTLPYSDATKDNACIQAELKHFPALKVRVMDAMVICSP